MSTLSKKYNLISLNSNNLTENDFKNSSSIVYHLPITYQHKKNKFKNIFTWYKEYSDDIKRLYYFIHQFKKNNKFIADQLFFIDFCVFCWNHSDLTLPYSY